jgi:hypothetical protein
MANDPFIELHNLGAEVRPHVAVLASLLPKLLDAFDHAMAAIDADRQAVEQEKSQSAVTRIEANQAVTEAKAHAAKLKAAWAVLQEQG